MDKGLAGVAGELKHGVDALSIGALVATWLNYLPTVTAVLVAVWSLLRIYDVWLSIQLKRQRLSDGE